MDLLLPKSCNHLMISSEFQTHHVSVPKGRWQSDPGLRLPSLGGAVDYGVEATWGCWVEATLQAYAANLDNRSAHPPDIVHHANGRG